MFDKDRFIQDCMKAVAEGQGAIREVVAEAVADRLGVMSELGEPEHAGITPIYRSPELTIINFVWAPCMSLMPHNHQMFAVVGIYSGREDNVFWRRTETTIEAAGAKSLGAGDVATLGRKNRCALFARLNCSVRRHTAHMRAFRHTAKHRHVETVGVPRNSLPPTNRRKTRER